MTKIALNIERDDLERQHPAREVWWLPVSEVGGGMRITWHSRVRGALNADLHADTSEHLGEYIAEADAEDAP